MTYPVTANPAINHDSVTVTTRQTVTFTVNAGENLIQSTAYATAKEPVYLVPRDVKVEIQEGEVVEIEITGPLWFEGETRDLDTYANYRSNRMGENEIRAIVNPAILHLLKLAKRAAGVH